MAEPMIPEIETERLLLRGFAQGDVEAWAAHLTDPEDFRYMPWRISDETPEQRSQRALAGMAKRWEAEPLSAMGWMFARKMDGRAIGFGGLEQVEGTNDGEIDYRIGKQFWGQGFAGEAARAMTRYGFENTGWSRIVAYIVPENVASVHIAVALGMTHEMDVDYAELLGDVSKIRIASTMTALYAVGRDQFRHGDAAYKVRQPG